MTLPFAFPLTRIGGPISRRASAAWTRCADPWYRRRVSGEVALREVTEKDIPVFFEHQMDPAATSMAAFPSRERAAYEAHWAKLFKDATVEKRTILFGGEVAGFVASFNRAGMREVCYWLGREFWSKRVATRGLKAFIDAAPERPLYARVAKHNVASKKVLENCGFSVIREQTAPDGVEEFLLRLG
jgi:RimJ/RimL family protein N-acetyltransferase